VFNTNHNPDWANDGTYGNGQSFLGGFTWFGPSDPNGCTYEGELAWLKVDLGSVTEIGEVKFGRDRTGQFADRDPGHFLIQVATSDNVYADDDETMDSTEYTTVFDSSNTYLPPISLGDTIRVQFPAVDAQFVKLLWIGTGGQAVIDEIEVFAPSSVGVLTQEDSAMVYFDVTDNLSASITSECRLDVGETNGTYTACTSPHEVTSLTDETYRMNVASYDGANQENTATFTWTVDATIGVPTFGTQTGALDDGQIKRAEAIAGFDVLVDIDSNIVEGDTLHFGLQGDTGTTDETVTASDVTNGNHVFSIAGIPTPDPNDDGDYTFEISASDEAGNVAATDTLDFSVDTVAPEITLNTFNSETTPIRLDIDTASYVEPGAQVTDNIDANSSADETGTVTNAATGVYTILYDAQDTAGNDAIQVSRTVTVSDVIIDDILVNGIIASEALWVEDLVNVNGTVEGALDGDTVTIVWGDGTANTTGIIPSLNGDGTGTWDAGASHTYAMSLSNSTVNIKAVLVGSEIATSESASLDIIQHPTSLALELGATSAKWDNNFDNNNATLTDTAASAGISGAIIKFGGVGVAGEGAQTATTGGSGTTPQTTLQAGKAVDVGSGKQVTATFEETHTRCNTNHYK
jgi:hypothetical protein